VENSLYQMALDGNVTAAIFYLKNRRPDRWRDVHNIEASNAFYLVSDKPMTEQEWQEWIEARAQRAKPVTQAVTQQASHEVPSTDSDIDKPLE
jgi:hypothetical protein